MKAVEKYLGDTVSCKALWSKEANRDAERQITSPGYILNQAGNSMRTMTKDFVLAQYVLTKHTMDISEDCNKVKPKFAV